MFFFRSSTSNFFSRLLMTEFCTRNPSFYLSLQLVWGRTSQQDPDGFFSGIFRFRWIFAVVAVVVVAGRVRPVVGRADARTLAPARAVETQRTLACQSLMIPAAQKKNPSPATSESDLMDNLLVLVPPPPTHPQPTPISSPNLSPPPLPLRLVLFGPLDHVGWPLVRSSSTGLYRSSMGGANPPTPTQPNP